MLLQPMLIMLGQAILNHPPITEVFLLEAIVKVDFFFELSIFVPLPEMSPAQNREM